MADAAIGSVLEQALSGVDGIVGFYWPIQSEFDARPQIATWLANGGKRRAALPVVIQRNALTILTYACFTGLSYFSHEWWHLLVFRFLAALGIGGEWAVGASLLSETWPKKWRPWIAATLQSAVNCGILLACVAGALLKGHPPQWIFLVGILPAFITLWIRSAVPETEEWTEARKGQPAPKIRE